LAKTARRGRLPFNLVAAVDPPYWPASGASGSNGTLPLPQAVPGRNRNATVSWTVTVFNDDFAATAAGFCWPARRAG
jgi:hypothetical protein